MMSPSEPGLMIRIDLGFKVGGQDTAPAAILFASVRAGLAFSEKPIHLSPMAEGRTRCPQRVEKMQ
jgi:hypothetical protein